MPIIEDQESFPGPQLSIPTMQEREEAIALDYDDQIIDTTRQVSQTDEGFITTLRAAARVDNSLVSWIANTPFSSFEEVEDYSPFDEREELEGYELYSDVFVDSVSPSQTAWLKSKIDQEKEDRAFIESQGLEGMLASMVAGTADPITIGTMFIPGTAVTKVGSAVYSGLRVGAGGAIGSGVSEIALHQTQQIRTVEESAINIVAEGLFGGLLGGGAQLLTNRQQRQELVNTIAKDLNSTSEAKSVGAAAVFQTTLDQETMKAAGLSKISSVSPIGRVMQSPSKVAREIGQRLAENNFTLRKNDQGIPTAQAAETMIKRWESVKWKQNQTVTDFYTTYKNRLSEAARKGTTPGENLEMTPRSGKRAEQARKPMSRLEFNAAIGKAMRRKDNSFIPEVTGAAKELRKVYDETATELVNLGLLDEGMLKVKTAPSYLNRVYDFEKIKNERAKFSNILKNYFLDADRIQYHKNQEQINILKESGVTDEELLTNKNYQPLLATQLSEEEVDDIVNEVINRITGAPNGMVEESGILPEGLVGKAGVLKERTLNIPDDMIEEFLESDITLVMDQYVRQIAPEIELTKAFGNKDMRDQIAEINLDYNELINAETSSRKIRALEKKRAGDIRDIEAMRDILIGTYGAPRDPSSFFVRAGRAARQVNFLRLLGGMTISAIPDLARPIMQNGLKNSASAIINFATANGRLKKMSLEELKEIGIGLDYVMSTRTSAMADLESVRGPKTMIENGLDKAANAMGNFTLMNQWNDLLKNWSGLVIQNRVIKAAEVAGRGGKLSRADLRDLSKLGLSKDDLVRINQQYINHGEADQGLRFGKSHLWEDAEIRDKYQAAILKDVDSVVVTPGAGDIPLMMRGEVGRIVLQFKTFIFGSSNRMLVAGVQQGAASFYYGAALSVALGALTYNAKQAVAGRPIDNDFPNLVKEGLDRSGMLGWISEPLAVTDKISGGQVGLWAMFGESQISRYQSRNIMGALAGPSFDLGNDMFSVVGSVLRGEWDEQQTRAIRKMIPYQNLFYFRPAMNELEEVINNSIVK